jgi:hypothetical protein
MGILREKNEKVRQDCSTILRYYKYRYMSRINALVYTGFMTEKQLDVLRFLVQTLTSEGIEFQASGGLAAIAYGGTRPLYDIDLEIYRKDAEKVHAHSKVSGTLFSRLENGS